MVTSDTPIRYLKGVGPERSKTLGRLGLHTLEDLFYFFPRRHEDRGPVKGIRELALAGKACVRGRVSSRGLIRTRGGQTIFKAVISDGKAVLFGVWFNQPYLSKVFLPKAEVVLYGQAVREGRHLQMVHPEYEILAPGQAQVHTGRIVPVYPLTEDLTQKPVRHLLYQVQEHAARFFQDPLPIALRKKCDLADSIFAFRQIHFPDSFPDRDRAYRRLVFDEFFLMQLAMQAKKKALQKQNPAISHGGGEDQVRRLLESLGFEPTAGQESAIRDILEDMKKDRPMDRLVQGDVGSGKTVVAAAAVLFTVSNGFQGALMAPTEVLAQQHAFNLTQLLEPFGVCCGYLGQGLSAAEKDRILAGIAGGEIQAVIGTHALIQERVKFRKLGLAVVDEQHKFGVFQRAGLRQKGGQEAHFLLLTATPIPRTLAMTLYGDLDISVIAELPEGRRPVKTFWVGEEKRPEIYAMLDDFLGKGLQGYVICPRVENEKEFTAKSVVEAHAELSRIFAHRRVGLLHGRMKSAEKKRVMQDFKEKRIELLVSTVVIEVGVDVPNATMMIIEDAERFGLAQLHQLRGRVGRGSEESLCVLFSDAAGEESAERLGALESMPSGFEVAERDLALRGAGDIVGRKQHGLPQLRIGDLVKDIQILETARKEAALILEKDPGLESPENTRLKRAMRQRFQ